MKRPVLGVSSCLLGNRVRWNGGDKKHPPVLEILGPRAVLVALCPEMEMGMGVPREPLTIVRNHHARPRLVSINGRVDFTVAMEKLLAVRIDELKHLKVCGYIMQSGSPSCGLGDASCVNGSGAQVTGEDGLFVATIKRRFPGVPLSNDKELDDRISCLRFLERAMRYREAVGWAR